jgi:hypothetical protein
VNEAAAVEAVYTVINAARATLVGSLTQNNQERVLKWLSRTILDTPPAYYAVSIHCENALEHSKPTVVNSANPNIVPAWVEYRMFVMVGEHATPDSSKAFDTAHDNFRKFCDRLVLLLRQTTDWFPTSGSSPRFRLKIERDTAQTVRKENILPLPVEDGTHILGAFIRFTLMDHCSDSSLLYE